MRDLTSKAAGADEMEIARLKAGKVIFPFLFAFLWRRRLVAALWICIALGPALRTLLSYWFDHLSRDDLWKAFSASAFAPAQFDTFSAAALLAPLGPFLASRLGLARVFPAVALGAGAAYACVCVNINTATLGFGGDAFRNVISGILWGQGRRIWLHSLVAGLTAALAALVLAGEGWLRAVTPPDRLRLLRRLCLSHAGADRALSFLAPMAPHSRRLIRWVNSASPTRLRFYLFAILKSHSCGCAHFA